MFKWNKNKISIFLLVLLLSTLCGCGSAGAGGSAGSPAESKAPAQSKPAADPIAQTEAKEAGEADISLYPGYIEIAKGSKVKLTPQRTLAGANVGELLWTSENPEIASVSAEGIVVAIKEGDTAIEAALKENRTKKAACAVHVNADGSTLAYAEIPQQPSETTEPPEDGKDGGKAEDREGEVPAEYEKSSDIPVEIIPSLDEFVWTIRIDDTCRKTLSTELGDIKADYRLKLTAVKNGGKTADGRYKCTAVQEVKIDSSDMDQKTESESGGKVTSDNTVKTQVKDCTFELVQYNSSDYSSYGAKKENTPAQPVPTQDKAPAMPSLPPLPPLTGNKVADLPELPPLPAPTSAKQLDMPKLSPLIPLSKMALGSMTFSTDAAFGRTVTTDEGSGTGKGTVNKKNNAVPFKIGVYKNGYVELSLINNSSMGSLQFTGRISKKPIRP
jgi:predicted small lipoprotein YifL